MSLLSHTLSDNDKFHCFKSDYADRSFDNALKRGDITPDDAILIRGYICERNIVARIGSKRILKIASNLITVRRFLGPFRDATIPDIYNCVNEIINGNSSKGKPFSQNTEADLIHILKSFYLWAIENEEVKLLEKKIKKIKVPKKITTKTAGDLLSQDEIEAILSACLNSRDRAILSVLYEGGFRVGEIGEMKWKDLIFESSGVIVNVTFKTGKTRYARLIMSREYLSQWKSDYPCEITDDAFVFISDHQTILTYPAIVRQLERIAKRAGITKHITPHIFRHTRITHLIQQGVNESVIKMMMWGSVESKMFTNYAHLTSSDTDRELFKLYGIDTTVIKTNEKVEPKICPRCHEINGPISKYCSSCGQALSDTAIKNDTDFNTFVLENSDWIIEFLNEKKAEQEKNNVVL